MKRSHESAARRGGLRRRVLAGAATAATVLLLASCGGGGGGGGSPPAKPTVARVVVSPANATVDVGKSVALTAQAFDATGAPLTRTFAWSSSDTTKATVDANGVVTGVAAGSASITATADSVASTPAALTVQTAAASQSSFELIDAALASGAIDLETAIQYKVFAAFKDTRLPAAYAGVNDGVAESDGLDLATANWATLSDAAKATLEPFFVPPAYQGSWLSLPSAGVMRNASKSAPSIFAETTVRAQQGVFTAVLCNRPTLDPNWAAKPANLDGHFKVWYDARIAGEDTLANIVLDALNTSWTTLIGTAKMKEPLSDGGTNGCDGGDGRLDVYLVDMAVMGANATHLGETAGVMPATSHAPVRIYLNRNLPPLDIVGTAAHEFLHASQWSYPTAAISLNYSYYWLMEATAQSAIDVVFPPNQLEQRKAIDYFATPDSSLEDRNISENRVYGSYLFFQFLERTLGATVLGDIWNATVTQSDEVQAVDKGIPGGFKEQWPKFAKLLWNQDPVNINGFQTWDSLALTPALRGGAPQDINLNSQPVLTQPLKGEIKHLASHYYEFRIADPNARSLSFFNHLYAFPQLGSQMVATQAFLKIDGVWQYDNWSDEGIDVDGVKHYCLDLVAERVTDLVIVMSNFDPKQDITNMPLEPRVSVSNVGCWRYVGTASVSINGSNAAWPSFTQTGDGSVTLERFRTAQQPNGAPNLENFQVISGAITGKVSASTAAGCTLTKTANDNMTAGAASGTLSVHLGLDIGTGTTPRDVSGSGSASANTHATLACPNVPDQTSTQAEDWSWLEFPTPSEMSVVVKPDGTIQGSYLRTLSGTNGTTGDETMIWNFTPQRQ